MAFTEVPFEVTVFVPLYLLRVQVKVFFEGLGVLIQLIARPTLSGFVVGRVVVNGRVWVDGIEPPLSTDDVPCGTFSRRIRCRCRPPF